MDLLLLLLIAIKLGVGELTCACVGGNDGLFRTVVASTMPSLRSTKALHNCIRRDSVVDFREEKSAARQHNDTVACQLAGGSQPGSAVIEKLNLDHDLLSARPDADGAADCRKPKGPTLVGPFLYFCPLLTAVCSQP